ncbi:mismatch-specific DNA-glycosylase [Rhodophyticola sp.]|jgi:TDG/mug DNA glycosylase family protein|uniref:mismatch-specific DNA-glycosylase n=1 Tax=Rhodophyticola sp. TaxID=2680032 RepID=UPI003D2CE3C3
MLPDYLAPRLKVLFCGTAAGRRSGMIGHYYAGRGNKFWKVLYEVGITDRLLTPESDRDVLDYAVGLTDLAKRVSGMDSQITRDAFVTRQLTQLLEEWEPRRLAFNGKRAAQEFLGKQAVGGFGRYAIDGFPDVWILPSTSGAANKYWSISPWQDLATDLTTNE